MAYTPNNNPYIAGDPYSYDLKWIVSKLKSLEHNASENISNIDFTTPEVYGAVGNGIHDDTKAVQDAINSGKANIVFTGTYLVKVNTVPIPLTDGTDASKAAIVVDRPVNIIGLPDSLIKGYNDDNDSLDNKFAFCVTSEHVNFYGLTIDNQYNAYRRGYGIQVNGSYVSIEHCTFKNNGSSAVVINGTELAPIHNVSVSHIDCSNMGNTIFACWADDLDFSDIYIKNASEGFDFDKRCRNVNMNNITVDTKRGTGADAAIEINSGYNFNISNVNITNFVDGILINGKSYNGTDYIAQDINIKNVNMDTINGYGIVCGNAIAGEIEVENLMISNVFVNAATGHALHLRGRNVIVNGAILTNCRYGAVLIDTADKSDGITLANVQSQGNAKGFIECTADTKQLTLLNINDDESANTVTVNQITNQTTVIINNMTVYGCTDLATVNGRVYTISAGLAVMDNFITEMLGNAFIGFSDSTERIITNSRLSTSAAQRLSNPSVYLVEGASPQATRIWNVGDIIVGNTGNVYLCTVSNVGGGSATFKQFTLT